MSLCSDRTKRRGAVLILALWVLGFLSVLAVQLGIGIRQRINFVKRIEERSRLLTIAESGILRSMAVVMEDSAVEPTDYTAAHKTKRHNNSTQFYQSEMEGGLVTVSYANEYNDSGEPIIVYGVSDEQSKLNINSATSQEILRLLRQGLGMSDDIAIEITDAIVGWRDVHDAELVGFYSDSYYRTLDEPYPSKNAPFEVLDELLLLKGMTQSVFDTLINYLTVYGNGTINFNTAPRPVLLALGLNEDLVSKIIVARRGADGKEASSDDAVFVKTHHIVPHLRRYVDISDPEAEQISNLNIAGRLTAVSRYYMAKSEAMLSNSEEKKVILCVFDQNDGKIKYWREY